MEKILMFGDKAVQLKSSAATPILYKQAFHEDMLMEMQKFTELKDKTEQASKMQDLVRKMAFIMNAEATTPQQEIFNSLTEQKFVLFLMEYDAGDIEANGAAIFELSRKNTKQNSQPKNA